MLPSLNKDSTTTRISNKTIAQALSKLLRQTADVVTPVGMSRGYVLLLSNLAGAKEKCGLRQLCEQDGTGACSHLDCKLHISTGGTLKLFGCSVNGLAHNRADFIK